MIKLLYKATEYAWHTDALQAVLQLDDVVQMCASEI